MMSPLERQADNRAASFRDERAAYLQEVAMLNGGGGGFNAPTSPSYGMTDPTVHMTSGISGGGNGQRMTPGMGEYTPSICRAEGRTRNSVPMNTSYDRRSSGYSSSEIGAYNDVERSDQEGASVLKQGHLTMIDGGAGGFLTTSLINHFISSLNSEHEVSMFAENTAMTCSFAGFENGERYYSFRVMGTEIFQAASPQTILHKIYSMDKEGWDLDKYISFNEKRKRQHVVSQYQKNVDSWIRSGRP